MAATRSQTLEDTAPTCYTEHFYYDDEDSSALTVLVHSTRFHIMVDHDELENAQIRDDYMRLLEAVKRMDAAEEGKDVSPSKKRKRDDDEYAEDEGQTDSGYGSSPPGPLDRDSEESTSQKSSVNLAEHDTEEDESRALHNWILEPFSSIFAAEAPSSAEKTGPQTVHDWYHQQTHFYTLSAPKDSVLTARKESSTADLDSRIHKMIPSLSLPKYIRSYHIPQIRTSDLQILQTQSMPSPLRPTIVRSTLDNTTYFLKTVDMSQPGPTKREIKILKELERKGVHERIRVPRIHALVVDDDDDEKKPSASRPVLGFLQTHIAAPTPLTEMLDTDVAEDKRVRWAKDAEKMVRELHDVGVVWGDAKADNFMVDEKANLWIIDFGGSYTEGWVDEELMETEEGDEMGLRKVVNALEDPEAGTFDPEEEADGKGVEDEREAKRRKVDLKQDEQVGEKEEVADEDEEVDERESYCYCGKGSEGTMVACDNDDCPMEWFHIECTGLKEVPGENDTWTCNDCQEAGKDES